ncbi:MAG TPA: M36 family metallopeptidase, partial [Chitinophagales bacterium]|nr:M36 family metallopeptidase [Chitinophagales bacterium]
MLVVAMFIAFAKEHKQAAIDFLQKNLTETKLTSQDIKDLILLDDSYDDFSHINRVWLQQTAYGIPLKNGMLSVHFMNGKVVNYTNNGIQDLKNKISSVTPSITAENAVRFAAAHVGVPSIGKIKLQEKVNKKENLYIFKPIDGLTNLEVHAQLLFTRDKNDKVVLDWEVQFHSLDQYNFWCIDVSAKDGSLIKKTDQVLHCDFGKGEFLGRHTHETEHTSINYRILDENLPSGATDGVSQTSAGSYRVYPFTVESPIYGARQLLVDPHDVVASPYGWHDTNGAAGAEYTYTRGNNVWAYTDKYDADPNTPTSLSTDGGASLVFDFNLDFTTQLDTLTNSKAITTQLFYANNIMHDIFFKYGFNESSRNFQFKNYSGASGGSDLVYAEAHDASLANPRLTNNATFATAPDGTSTPFNRTRMQMYMWDGAPPSSLTYNAPASIAGDIDHGSANGWGPCSYNVTAPVANATSNTAPPSYVCGAVNNPGDIAGKIALIDRGTCNFTEKVYNVQLAGAVGAIIINRQSAGDSLIGMASGTNGGLVTIPAMFVTYADGQKLRDNLATANVTMYRNSTTNCLDLDGSLDFGIVAHEYAHGISTRLTGLSLGTGGTSGCLSNEEQAGEGWGDFFAMALTKKPTDNKNTPRGMGNYAASQDVNGQGIRRYPYSYDMSINPLTYGDLNLNPEKHDIGQVWTSALWDMYWLLVEKHGYSNDLYNGTGGNNRAIKIVVEGLKQQKCNPGFLDSRNAILKADSILYGYADKCEIWTAFARRGMGASANQGSAGSASDQTEAFDLPAACNTTPTATASFTVSDTTVCVGGSLTFTNTSTASSGSPDSVRWTILGGTPSTSNSAT